MSGENTVHEWKTILLTTVVISRTFCMHGEQKKGAERRGSGSNHVIF